MNILVLGHKGMLGHMLVKYLTDQGYIVETIEGRFPDQSYLDLILKFKGDFIINCVGAIPQKTNTYFVNYLLPVWLDVNTKSKIIHPGTDCEIDENEYGTSKRIASDIIKLTGVRTKIIKTSIIGPELSSHTSLLDWFLHSEADVVQGYTDAMWNGVTTLDWAIQCKRLMEYWEDYDVETIVEAPCISKKDLLSLIKDVFEKDITIESVTGKGKNKCLTGGIKVRSHLYQLQDLKKYYYDTRS